MELSKNEGPNIDSSIVGSLLWRLPERGQEIPIVALNRPSSKAQTSEERAQAEANEVEHGHMSLRVQST